MNPVSMHTGHSTGGVMARAKANTVFAKFIVIHPCNGSLPVRNHQSLRLQFGSTLNCFVPPRLRPDGGPVSFASPKETGERKIRRSLVARLISLRFSHRFQRIAKASLIWYSASPNSLELFLSFFLNRSDFALWINNYYSSYNFITRFIRYAQQTRN